MYIESADINEFGFFSGKKLVFGEGINLIYGRNESGKSTVADFIRFIFYGFSGKPDRDRHIKLTGNTASGSLVLNTGEKRYRVERRVTGTKDVNGIYDLSDGSQCFKGEVPGEVFFGIPEKLYDATVFVGQLGGSRIDGRTVSESVDNLMLSADESVSIKKILKKIDDARVGLLYKNEKGGRIYELKNAITECRVQLSEAEEENSEIVELRGAVESYGKKLDTSEKEYNRLKYLLYQYEKKQFRQRKAKLETLESEWNSKREELDDFRKNNTHEGYFPDEEYYSDVCGMSGKFSSACDREKEIEDRLDDLSEKLVRSDEERRAQKEENVRKCGVLSRKRIVLLCASVIGCIMFAAFGALAVAAFASDGGISRIVYAVLSVLSIIGFSVGFTMSARCASELNRVKSEIDGNDDEDHYRLEVMRGELEEARNEKERHRKALCEMCSKWGYDQPAVMISDLKDMLETEKKLDRECETCRQSYTAFKSAILTSHDVEDDGMPVDLPDGFNIDNAEKRYKLVEALVKEHRDRKHDSEIKYAELSAKAVSASEIEEKISEYRHELEKCSADHRALVIAGNALAAASEKIRKSVSPRLSALAGKYMEAITDGRYGEIGIDGKFTVTFRPEVDGGRVTAGDEYMSSGTSDAVYVSLRLALAVFVSGEKMPPMVFDESFSRLDAVRLKGTLRLLAGCGMQIILMTSSDRETELLEELGAEYQKYCI